MIIMGDELKNMDLPEDGVLYEVGKSYPLFRTGRDGYILEYDGETLMLYVQFCGWKKKELRQIRSSEPARFAFVEAEGVGFLCVKFGDLPWGDCPFHPGIYTDRVFEQIDFGDSMGIPLVIVFADSSTGEVVSLRMIGMGNDFSRRWHSWLLSKAGEKLSREEYNRRIDKVYGTTTSSALAFAAPCRWMV